MKYDDDELAEAALLLAHEEARDELPAELQRKILARSRFADAGARFSTTKAAAVAVEADPRALPLRSSSRAWVGWLAAAACVALAVFQWRTYQLDRDARDRAAATSSSTIATLSPPIVVRDGRGIAVAEVRWNETSRTGRVDVATLPPLPEGERYELWVSANAAASAVQVGSFSCSEGCRERAFALREPPAVGTVRRAWITRGRATRPSSPAAASVVVGEGGDGAP